MKIIERRFLIVAIALATFAVAISQGPGPGSGVDTATAQNRDGGKHRSQHHGKAKKWLSAQNAAKAVRLAYRRVGGEARPYEIEAKFRRFKPVWEVEVARGEARPIHVVINARATKVLGTHRGRPDVDAVLVQEATVPLAKAIRIAKRHVPKRLHQWKTARGSLPKWMKMNRFDEAGIDWENERLVWEVSFNRFGCSDVEVQVDAKTGKVLGVEGEHRKDRRHSRGIKKQTKYFC